MAARVTSLALCSQLCALSCALSCACETHAADAHILFSPLCAAGLGMCTVRSHEMHIYRHVVTTLTLFCFPFCMFVCVSHLVVIIQHLCEGIQTGLSK